MTLVSIQRNPSDPKLFSNRALSRIKLQDWAGAELDARKAIELYGPKNPSSMKPYYYLAQALLGLQHPVEALETAKYAYKICLEIRDSSSEVLSQFILRTRQAQWQRKETARLRELNQTLAEVEDLFQGQLDRELQSLKEKHAQGGIGEVGMQEEQKELEREAQAKQTTVREAFRNAQTEEAAERVSKNLSLNLMIYIAVCCSLLLSSLIFSRIHICQFRLLRSARTPSLFLPSSSSTSLPRGKKKS